MNHYWLQAHQHCWRPWASRHYPDASDDPRYKPYKLHELYGSEKVTKKGYGNRIRSPLQEHIAAAMSLPLEHMSCVAHIIQSVITVPLRTSGACPDQRGKRCSESWVRWWRTENLHHSPPEKKPWRRDWGCSAQTGATLFFGRPHCAEEDVSSASGTCQQASLSEQLV